MIKYYLFLTILLFGVCSITAQLKLPRESQSQSIKQTIGDTELSIAFSRPNAKGRTIFGGLVPYDKVWRTGANEATVFEVSRDVNINGKALPAGKYSLHTIPTATSWTIIFNKTANQWGSFDYDEKADALRVVVNPNKSPFTETFSIDVSDVTAAAAKITLSWANISVPFTLDIGDIHARNLGQIRTAIENAKDGDAMPTALGANYVTTNKLKANYDEALGWVEKSVAMKETFFNLSVKAKLQYERGSISDAITTGNKAVEVGTNAKPPANPDAIAEFQKTMATWPPKK